MSEIVKKEKIAVITGASRGLGRELSRLLAEKGYHVAGIARNGEQLKSLQVELAGRGLVFEGFAGDVSSTEEMSTIIQHIFDRWGWIDLAIANAGISGAGWAAKQSPDKVHELLAVNFMGMVNLFSPIIPRMIERHQGQLVGIASIAAYRGMPALSSYAASKAAMRSYLETLRIELKSRGISVSIVSPGYFDSEMTADRGRPMPFLVSLEQAARLTVQAIEAHSSEYIFPFPLALMTRLLNFLPNSLFDKIITYL